MKNTNTGTGFGGLGNLEALGSKIVGPKISVIKRWFFSLKLWIWIWSFYCWNFVKFKINSKQFKLYTTLDKQSFCIIQHRLLQILVVLMVQLVLRRHLRRIRIHPDWHGRISLNHHHSCGLWIRNQFLSTLINVTLIHVILIHVILILLHKICCLCHAPCCPYQIFRGIFRIFLSIARAYCPTHMILINCYRDFFWICGVFLFRIYQNAFRQTNSLIFWNLNLYLNVLNQIIYHPYDAIFFFDDLFYDNLCDRLYCFHHSHHHFRFQQRFYSIILLDSNHSHHHKQYILHHHSLQHNFVAREHSYTKELRNIHHHIRYKPLCILLTKLISRSF